MTDEQVVLELHDLHFGSSSIRDDQSGSSERNSLSLLKNKLREPMEIPFSMKFNTTFEITKDKILNDEGGYMSVYDVEIVNDRDLMLFGTNSKLHFYNLTSRKKLKTIHLTDVSDIHEIVVEGLYMYLTSGSRLFKYNLDLLLLEEESSRAMIWQSSPPSVLSNCWGLALKSMGSQRYAFVMDYGEGILVFDTITGNRVPIKIPKITTGYGVAFTQEDEMIISTSNTASGPIQILTFNSTKEEWEIAREVKRNSALFNTPYGICYEKKTQSIYLMDTFAKFIYVYDKRNMELVHKWKLNDDLSSKTVYGISLDFKKGELYLPVCDNSVVILS